MTDTEAFAFARFVNDLTYTIFFVFGKVGRPDTLIEWLRPLVSDEASRSMLMHEEPLYIAADFLGVDRLAPSFAPYEKKYQEFRAGILYPSRS